MKRLFSCLLLAGLLAAPAVASAEPQYVYVRYGDGRPYVYVTTTPQPYPYYQPTYYVRADGTRVYYTTVAYSPSVPVIPSTPAMRFDSDVGAACGTRQTDVFFSPGDTSLDASDRTTLSTLGYCLSRGQLAGARITLAIGYDGTSASLDRSYERQSQVVQFLSDMGVPPSQIAISHEIMPGWQADRVRFRLAAPVHYFPYL